jgi:hypothetical protein
MIILLSGFISELQKITAGRLEKHTQSGDISAIYSKKGIHRIRMKIITGEIDGPG